MSGAAWHTRIACGTEVGADFPVSARQVLTCAHVVRHSGTADVRVSFPNRAELGELTATVAVHGGWRGGDTDPGDLAVLELEHEVPLAPAVFAPPGAEHGTPSPELVAYGFPRGYEEGTLALYRALPGPLIAGEWIQLEAVSGHGQPLAEGFSGADLRALVNEAGLQALIRIADEAGTRALTAADFQVGIENLRRGSNDAY